jgi:hypothetical protein
MSPAEQDEIEGLPFERLDVGREWAVEEAFTDVHDAGRRADQPRSSVKHAGPVGPLITDGVVEPYRLRPMSGQAGSYVDEEISRARDDESVDAGREHRVQNVVRDRSVGDVLECPDMTAADTPGLAPDV